MIIRVVRKFIPSIINLLAFLCDCSTMEQLDAAFNTTRSNFTFVVNKRRQDDGNP